MAVDQNPIATGRKRCFVVMGFGIKTDFATGRKLDLDKSYRLLIKPVVERQALECIRADEIRHSGTIDVPMYQQLLNADVVIADISTANPNALYELGIRHALRPRTTIVISENKLSYPFDLNHVMITSYTHLGEHLDYDEVLRFQDVLSKTLRAVLDEPKTDSPVYIYLSQLAPPTFGGSGSTVTAGGQAQELKESADAFQLRNESVEVAQSSTAQPAASTTQDRTLATLIEQGEEALRKDKFPEAKALFALALRLCQEKVRGNLVAVDPYLLQRLVLATYKAKQPNEQTALEEAQQLLARLNPADSNDPETVGLAGAIDKRLYDLGQGVEYLNRAIRHYGRGYFLRGDHYNGINLAYLLNVRSDTTLARTTQDRIADLIWANRIRREVLTLCDQELAELRTRARRLKEITDPVNKLEQGARDSEQKFWCLVTKAEAHFGLGEIEAYETCSSEAQALQPASWKIETFQRQIARLKVLLEKYAHLLDPSWPQGRTADPGVKQGVSTAAPECASGQ